MHRSLESDGGQSLSNTFTLQSTHGTTVQAVIIKSLYTELSGTIIRSNLATFSGADLTIMNVTNDEVKLS